MILNRKKMDVPEKIYIQPNAHDGWFENDPNSDNFVEYIRTDALIEKALKWYCLDCECNDNCNANHKCFFRQEYKRYLEGAANALPPKFGNAINPDGGTEDNYRYRHFIRKMRDYFIEKACEWLKSNLYNYAGEDDKRNIVPFDNAIFHDFQKAMEE